MASATDSIPEKFTAAGASFPTFATDEPQVICFNLRGDEAGLEGDQAFRWQGSYAELDGEGQPICRSWKDKLEEIASKDGAAKVKERFCSSRLAAGERAFYAPAKARRWGPGILGSDRSEAVSLECVLVRSADGAKWRHVELSPTDGAVKRDEAVSASLLGRLTYATFDLDKKASAKAAKPLYGKQDPSEAAWMDGSTIVKRASKTAAADGRVLTSLPSSCLAVRFVPLAKREKFLKAVEKVPTFAVTGATLPQGSELASPVATPLAEAFGREVGGRSRTHGIRLMASASMRGMDGMFSADHDFTKGFNSCPGCDAVHFKGSNLVKLHGRAWTMEHGTSYVVEEEADDFSNHAKEACLMVCSKNSRSSALLACGGPTVSLNLCRMLLTCSANRVFAVTGMHSKSGKSGASGSFPTTSEQQESAVQALYKLAPGGFFKDFETISSQEIAAKLETLPLGLLHHCQHKGCDPGTYVMQPGKPNEAVYPGIVETDHIAHYVRQAASIMEEQLRPKPKLRKPKFGKVKSLVVPEAKGVNVVVKCVRAPERVEGAEISEVLCGDETGTVMVSLRSDERVAVCSAGASLRIQNAHVRMVKGHIRLVVDKWAALKPADAPLDAEVDEKNNVSAVEYELA
eukprot:TRINITY_DN14050_c0_g1_i1.p1 TRINITY_DN14050_c0_g1~~TRINITY_DN14050_c0_g1_i1.p1  ORF type:complete len:631 (-),score=161.28 TRINITY_DN14050_c0_g1_i1:188-2080(-)